MQKKIKLLIIEDDLTQSFLISESLDEELYDILRIQDGSEALDLLLSGSIYPDLILLDYHLPNLDGLGIMNKLKENDKHYNIIFLTADYSIETAIKSINAGALEFIPKDGRFVQNIQAIVNKAYQTVIDRAERNKFELALKESEDRFKIVMEASKDGIFEWNSSDSSFHISPNNAYMLQYSLEEYPATYQGFMDLIHPDDRNLLMQKFMEHHHDKTSHYEAEIRMKARDGTYKWVLERGIIAQLDKNGDPVRVIGTQSDISGRKAAEEKLIEANTRLTTLIGNLPGIVYRCKNMSFCNKEFLGGKVMEITGFSESEFNSEFNGSFVNIIHPDDKNLVQEQVKIALQNKTDFELYYRIIIKNKDIRWIWDHGKTILDKEGNIIAIEGYLADITDMRLNEEALKLSEEEKNIILDNSFQAFILAEPDGKVIAFNKTANHRVILTTGKSVKKGINLFDCFPGEEKEQITVYFNKVIGGEPFSWEQSYSLRGELSWYENVMVPIFISPGKIKFVCYTSSDITERKNFEKRIMNAIIETEERERKRVSEDLHDELGSLLSTIKIYINTLYREDVPHERRGQLIDLTNLLINQAIDSSKEIANNLSPNIILRFGLISAIQSMCEKIQSTSGLNVYFDSSSYCHFLKADEEISVYRIISELVNNTLKHAEAKNIHITFKSSDPQLNIDYSDDGKGFDFEKTISENVKGLGLQNIASRIGSLGGTYKIENTENKGFAILIELLIPAGKVEKYSKAN
jgi:PAS domain S-box-containing protein